jgi:hypothetical protein
MKNLLLLSGLLLSLSGCVSPSVPNPAHQAISTVLQKELGDSAMYQPVRWGEPQPCTRGDSAVIRAYILGQHLTTFNTFIKSDSTKLIAQGKLSKPQETLKSINTRLAFCRYLRDSVSQLARALPALNDTTRLGYYIKHAFKFRNITGAFVLDSAEFYVDKHGKVRMVGY